MITAFLVLIACELVGEIVRQACSLPIPGPVIGMFCLAGVLAWRKDKLDAPAIPDALGDSAETLIGHMGLLFIPAGVGIISEANLKNLFRTPARAWLKAEPEELKPDGEMAKLEKPQRFESHVYRALAEGYIASTKAASLLRRPVADVEHAVKGKQ